VRVYAGLDPVTHRQRALTHTIPDGPTALEDAEAACRRLLTQVRENRQPRTDITLGQLLARHLATMHGSDTTRYSYQCMITKHVQPLLGRLAITAVTGEVLDHFYAELLRCRDHCRKPRAGHRCWPLAPATVRKIHYLVSGAYRRAVRWHWLDHNPAADAEPPPKPRPEPQPPTAEEAARIMAAAWRHPDLGPLVWLAMVTGARRGELCALRWRHFDPSRRVLVIRASIGQVRTETWEKDTKLHQRRHVTLDERTCAMLTAYHQARQQRAATVGASLTPDSFLFSARPDAAVWRAPDSLTRLYRRLVTRLGIRTTLHKLRHYSATELIAAGADIRTVAGRLGHAEGGTTLAYYTAWLREADHRASDLLITRLPMPATPAASGPPATARTAQRLPSPHQVIATELRSAITTGTIPRGAVLSSVKLLAATPARRADAPIA
jgi:integrase